MKKVFVLLAEAMLSAGVLRAAEAVVPVEETAAAKAARAEVTKVLAIEDNEKAAEKLIADIRAMYKDNDGQAAKDGVPELTIALLVKTDFARANVILPIVFGALTTGMPLDAYERLAASALMAAGDNAAELTTSILAGLQGQNRWMEAVTIVAKDTPRPLPTAMRQAIRAISATVLPPAVTPPEGIPPPVVPPAPYNGQ